ncbi:IPT/TIG domain-containing protein [Streptomyces sp. NPDC002920]
MATTRTATTGALVAVAVLAVTLGGGSAAVAAAPARPTVTALSASSGPVAGGTRLTVAGKNFTRVTSVRFGSSPGTRVAVASATRLTVTAPRHAAGRIDVVVTAAGGTSAAVTADRFTYVAPPAVTAVAPAAGPTAGGTLVTLTGKNFTKVTGVAFGSASGGSVRVASSTKLTAVAPKHAVGRVDIRVTTAYGTSGAVTADGFTYAAAPAITSVSPAGGPVAGGTTVTVTGTNLTGASGVTFGGVAGKILRVASATSVTVAAPPHAAGSADVRVRNPGGTSPVTAGGRFTYAAPGAVTAAEIDGVTTTGATLTWTNPTDAAFRGVMIRRAAGTVAPATPTSGTLAASTSGPVDLWTDAGLTPGATYSYALFADDGATYGHAAGVHLTVTLPTRPSLAGTVTGSSGAPVQGATVSVLNADGVQAAHTTTNSRGMYDVAGLTPGTYTVCFDPAGGDAGATTGSLPACHDAVTVRADRTATGVDAVLAPAGGLTGTVTDTAGQPIAEVTVVIGDAGGEPLAETATAADGTWNANWLPPGAYTVCYDPATVTTGAYAAQCHDKTAPTATPTPVTVTAGSRTAGLHTTLAPASPTSRALTALGTAAPRVVSTTGLSALPCADVLFLAARGSGESGPGGVRNDPADPDAGVGGPVHTAYRAFVSALSNGRTVTPPVSVSYPADNVTVLLTHALSGAYIRDLDSGVAEARRALTERAAVCPNERVVLAGYSQGAMLAHRVLEDATVPGAQPLTASVRARVDAALLIADGDRVAGDTTRNYGTARPTAQGIGTKTPGTGTVRAKLPASLGALTFSVCNAGDLVCDYHVPACAACTIYGIHVHLGYSGSLAVTEAAQDAAAWEETFPAVGGAPVRLTGTTGVWFDQRLTAVGAGTLVWALAPGSRLPAGLTLGVDGRITGFPTSAMPAQDIDFTLTVTDPLGVREAPVTVRAIVSVADGTTGPSLSWTTTTVPVKDPVTGSMFPTPYKLSCGSQGLCVENMAYGAAYTPPKDWALSGGSWSDTSEQSEASCGVSGVCAAANGNLWTAAGSWSGTTLPMPDDYTPGGSWDVPPQTSCGSVCAAVGTYLTSTPTGFTEHSAIWTLNGGAWSVQAAPMPAGDSGTVGYLGRLACGADGACAAVGQDDDHDFLIARTAGVWKATRFPLPADADPHGNAGADQFSCGDGACAAIGGYTATDGNAVTAFVTLRAGTWSMTPITGVPSGVVGTDWQISCGDGGVCTAIETDPANGTYTGIWQLTGGHWAHIDLAVPDPGYYRTALHSVSCGQDQTCVVTGSSGNANYLWTYTDGTWHTALAPLPASAGLTTIFMASCGAGGFCAVSGAYQDGDHTVSAVWSTAGGGSWNREAVPAPSDLPAGQSVSAYRLVCGWGEGAVCALSGSMSEPNSSPAAVLWTLQPTTGAAQNRP